MQFTKQRVNLQGTNKEQLMMKRLLRFIMKVYYANENYAKYGVPGMNYFVALMMATFFIMMTLFMILMIFGAIFPTFDEYSLAVGRKLPAFPSAIVIIGGIFFLLRAAVKEDDLKDSFFTKEYVKKAFYYLYGYLIVVLIIIVSIGRIFLAHRRR